MLGLQDRSLIGPARAPAEQPRAGSTTVEARDRVVDQRADPLHRGMPTPFRDPVGDLVANVAEELAEAVLGRRRSRLAFGVASGLARGAARTLAGRLRFTQLTLQRRHPLLDRLGGLRRPLRSSRP